MLTVHWDGKLLPDLIGQGKVDRLPVLITYDGNEKMLGIPKIESGSGTNQAFSVHKLLQDWGLPDKVQAVCCDTTSSNMGRFQGACVYLEQILKRDLLYLPCRHHIYEIILRGAFDEKISQSSGPTSGPTISIFKKFQESWPRISKQKFLPGIQDEYVRQSIQCTNEILGLAMQTLQNVKQPREDCREFLELVIIFLGKTPPPPPEVFLFEVQECFTALDG